MSTFSRQVLKIAVPVTAWLLSTATVHAKLYLAAPASVSGAPDPSLVSTRLYTVNEDGTGLTNLGSIRLGGTAIPVSAVAMAPDGTLYGTRRAGISYSVVTIDPTTSPPEATTFSTGSIDEYLLGFGIDRNNRFYAARANGTIQEFDPTTMVFSGPAMSLGSGGFTSTNVWGADIAFDASNTCIVVLAKGSRNEVFSCDPSTGSLSPLTLSINGTFVGGSIRFPGVAASVNASCEAQYFVADGGGTDEIAALDYDANASAADVSRIASLGINYSRRHALDLAALPQCSTCGNGQLDGAEVCDDGNTDLGDGCNAGCQVEFGYVCSIVGAACSETVCGDGVAEGADEVCDDGDTDDTNACSNDCTINLGFGTCSLDTDCEASNCGPDNVCGSVGSTCSDDAECVDTCISGTCSLPVAPGESCDSAADCTGGSACTGDVCGGLGGDCTTNTQCVDTCIAGTCSELSSVSGNCDANDPDDCTGATECDGDGSCGGNGAGCADNTDCIEQCIDGTCSGASSVGGACDASDDSDCDGDVVCVGPGPSAGTCGGNGGTCSDNLNCVGTCIGGTCSDPSDIIGNCDADDHDDCEGALQCNADGNCGGTGAGCANNAECDATCISEVCTATASLSESCDANDDNDCTGSIECSASGVCGGDTAGCSTNSECIATCIASVCAELAGLGETCDADDSDDCSGETNCNASGTCGGTSAACSTNVACVDVCIESVCAVQSGPGGSCDASDHEDCHSGALCSAEGVCGGPGTACTSNNECDEVCISGFCTVEASLGGNCDASEDADCDGTVKCSEDGVCGGPGSACSLNAECLGTCIGGECSEAGGVSEPCDPEDDEDCSGTIECSSAGLCGGATAGCSENLDCIDSCIASVCAEPVALGQACDEDDDDDCAGEASCNSESICGGDGAACSLNAACIDVCVGNVCAAPRSPGGTCDPNDHEDCLDGASCTTGGICGGEGTACSANNECVEVCIAGFCTTPAGVGGRCDALQDDDCTGGLECANDGTCGGNGTNCSNNDDCTSTCIAGTCSETSGLGHACDNNDDDDCAGPVECNSVGVCGGNGGGCEANAHCIHTCVDGGCEPPNSVGGRCDTSDDDDCAGEVSCSPENTCGGNNANCDSNMHCEAVCVAGSCTTPGPADGPCDSGEQADCSGALVCSPEGVCGGLGAPCEENNECSGSCIAGFCGDVSEIGAACDADDHEDCRGSLNCNSDGICGGDDAPCSGNSDCFGACIAGACSDPAVPGAGCDLDDDDDCRIEITCNDEGICGGDGAVCAENTRCAETCLGQRCTTRQPLNSPCDENDNDDCEDGLICNSDLRCVEPVCERNTDCNDTCIDSECVEPAGLRGDCDPLDDEDCSDNLGCGSDGVCGGTDAPCAENTDCVFTCISDRCSELAENGSRCDVGDNDDCVDGSCLDSGTCLDCNDDCGSDTSPDELPSLGGGGVGCGVASTTPKRASWLGLATLIALVGLRRRRQHRNPRGAFTPYVY